MKSLRARLLVGMIGSFALLLVVFGLVIDAAIEYMLVREFDFYLETVVRTLAAAVEPNGARIEVKLVPEALPDIPQVEGELFSQYWIEDGVVLAKSANLAQGDLPRFAGPVGRPLVQPLTLPDGRPARAAGLRFPVNRRLATSEGAMTAGFGSGADLTLVVARDTTDLASHVRQLRWLLLAAGAGTMTAGAFVSWLVIQRSLRPLDRLAATIATIREDDLSARLPATTRPQELAPLVERLNELLQRLDDAFARERSLTADIAHELRTPVAGILSTAGVTLTADRSPEQYREALADVRSIARQMRIMIDNLLMLARLDAQAARFRLEPVPIRELVEAGWRPCEDKATARGLSYDNRVSSDLVWDTDRNSLAIVFANLLDNAVEYANETGRIWVTADRREDAMEVEVVNTGCQLTEDQVTHVFDRFWRADASRKDASLHVGLGLPLVRRLVTALGGAVSAEAARGLFTVRIRLPTPRELC
jgi:two-component system sensor histidine kinase QseC